MYVYITGRGHSGSTILDMLLGNSSQIESVGELITGLKDAERGMCSCGVRIHDCAFWREIRSRVEAQGMSWDEASRLGQPGAVALWRVWRAGPADPAMMRRAEFTQALDRAITACAGRPHLVDSSKTLAHGLLLLRYLPAARLIHLVRDPRQVLTTASAGIVSPEATSPYSWY